MKPMHRLQVLLFCVAERGVIITSQEREIPTEIDEQEAKKLAERENAKHVLRESGLAEMLQAVNRNLLKGRGWFEEYDTLLLFKWGTGYTKRHIWVEVEGSNIRFRLLPHRKCAAAVPICDGEYHTLTQEMWSNHNALQEELHRRYDRPVAESSSD
jgi:hypothetical protein